MSSEAMLARASHVFIGVIQKHQLESWPFFRLKIPGANPADAKYWKILRREVRIEMVLRGTESRKVVDVYEIFWTDGTSGDWNSTQDRQRFISCPGGKRAISCGPRLVAKHLSGNQRSSFSSSTRRFTPSVGAARPYELLDWAER
jgi:hypothetical protein